MIVEQSFISANQLKAARAYIVYREQHTRLRRPAHPGDVETSINEPVGAGEQ